MSDDEGTTAGSRASSSGYSPPVADMLDALDGAGLDRLLGLDGFTHIDRADVEMAVREFGRFAADVIAPTDRVGDVEGVHFDPTTGAVTTPVAFHDAYRRYVEGGWGALQFPEAFGGGGFPAVVALALQEMFASANLALSLNPVLTQGAIDLLLAWGSDEQRARYLPRLLSGEWSGTMALTEPDAGSDLSRVATRAELGADGRWRVTGTKIFLTWGEHDLSRNIVHVVLARTPGAPLGSRGISTFLVPKLLVGDGGDPDAPNALRCTRVEAKLGIHGSPTCAMEFDGALAELVGEEHGGLHAMFTMMNATRLSVGLEGPAVGERAYQQALAYASTRVQGHPGGHDDATPSRIIEHPDVRRMLFDMRTRVLAARLLVYVAAAHGDRARHGPDETARQDSQAMIDLLTPIAKAWSSEAGVAVASLGIQVLGGSGFLDESGMSQRLRDVRITPIYEGTNGIQAIDLVTRKIGRDGGRTVARLLDEIDRAVRADLPGDGAIGVTRTVLGEARGALERTTAFMLDRLEHARDDALAGATAYLELAGATIAGWLLMERARRAVRSGGGDREVADSEFFASETMARARGLERPITSGAARLGSLT